MPCCIYEFVKLSTLYEPPHSSLSVFLRLSIVLKFAANFALYVSLAASVEQNLTHIHVSGLIIHAIHLSFVPFSFSSSIPPPPFITLTPLPSHILRGIGTQG